MAMHKSKKQRRFQPGGLVTTDGKPVLDGSNQPIMTGSFPEEDEITARGRAKNAEMVKSLVNRVTGRGQDETKKVAEMDAAKDKLAQDVQKKLQADKTVKDDADFAEADRVSSTARAQAGKPAASATGQGASGQTFGQAFAAARKAGDKKFNFNGKSFTTETKEDVAKRGKKPPPVIDSYRLEGANRPKPAASSQDSPKPAASSQDKKNDGTEISAAQKFRDENKKGVSPILTGLLGFGAGFAGKKLVQAGAKKLASIKAKKKAALQSQMAAQQTPTKFASTKTTSVKKSPTLKTSPKGAKKFGEDESGIEFKRGGKVGASSASKRADGIAQRGKTRGRMY